MIAKTLAPSVEAVSFLRGFVCWKLLPMSPPLAAGAEPLCICCISSPAVGINVTHSSFPTIIIIKKTQTLFLVAGNLRRGPYFGVRC